jgi:hypothetical protein
MNCEHPESHFLHAIPTPPKPVVETGGVRFYLKCQILADEASDEAAVGHAAAQVGRLPGDGALWHRP